MNSRVIRSFAGRPKDLIYLLASLFLIVLVTSCNGEEIDSSGESYKKHIALAEKYVNIDLDSAVMFANKAVENTKNQNDSFGKYHSQLVLNEILWLQSGAKEIDPKELRRYKVWFKEHGYREELVRLEILRLNTLALLKSPAKAWNKGDDVIALSRQSKDDLSIAKAYFFKMSHRDNARSWDDDVFLLDSARIYAKRSKNTMLLGKIRLMSVLHVNGSPRCLDSIRLTLNEARRGNLPLLECNAYESFGLANSPAAARLDSSLFYTRKGISLSKRLGSPIRELHSAQLKMDAFDYAGKIDSVLECGEQALELARDVKYQRMELIIMRDIASQWRLKEQPSKGLSFARKALEVAQKTGDQDEVMAGKHILAKFLSQTKRYEEAKKMANEVLEWQLSKDSTFVNNIRLANSYFAMANLYEIERKDSNALKFFKKALNVMPVSAYNHRFKIDANILSVLIRMKLYADAEQQCKVIDYAYSVGQRKHPLIQYLKGKLMVALGRYNQGIKLIESYLESSNAVAPKHLYVGHKTLGEAYSKTGRYAKAQTHYSKALIISEEIHAKEDDLKLEKGQSKYELSQKETKIEKLENDKLRQKSISDTQKNELQTRRLWNIFLIVLLLFSGTIVFFVFRSYRNVQLRKEVEKKAREKEQKMERLKADESKRLLQMKNQLFANISHEFRTPLTLILAPVEEMMENLSKEERERLKTVQRNTEDLLVMVEEMLELARMDSGTINLSKKDLSLNDFMNEIHAGFTTLFKQRSIDFKMLLPKVNTRIQADTARLKMVMNNLLKNAFHYTPELGTVIVNVEANLEKGMLHVVVFNSGERIDEDFLPHLFERYTRSEQSEYIGYGIGLSLCKEIVAMHNGIMDVNNIDGKGVQFSFSIPTRIEPVPASIPKSAIREGVVISEQPEKDAHVLIVEDNREMRSLLDDVLKDHFKLTFAIDGEEGIRKAQEVQPDLIVSDVMMPKLDGMELTQLIRKEFDTSHIPVILLTAKSEQEDRLQGLETGADDYLTKPFSPKELRVRIKNLIKLRAQLRERFAKDVFVQPEELACTSLDKEFLTNAINLVEANMMQTEFNVEKLCQELALNRNSVHIKLKSLTGYSTTQFMRSVKLKKAATLLKDDRNSISAVSDLAGFNNRQAFNKAFKELFDMTPTAFREKVKKNENPNE